MLRMGARGWFSETRTITGPSLVDNLVSVVCVETDRCKKAYLEGREPCF